MSCLAVVPKHDHWFNIIHFLANPPTFKQDLEDITKAAMDRDITIECAVTGAPPPSFEWSKDNELLDTKEGK